MSSPTAQPPLALDSFYRLLRRILLCAACAPRTTLLLWFLALAFLGSQVPDIRVAISVSDIVEPNIPSVQRTRQLRELFGGEITGLLVVAPESGNRKLQPEELLAIEGWIQRQRAGNREIAKIFSGFDIRRQTISPLGRLEVPVVRPHGKKNLQPLVDSPWGGVLTNEHGGDFAIALEFNPAPPGGKYGRFNPDVLGNLLADLENELAPFPDLMIVSTGNAAFQHYALEGIRKFQYLNLGMMFCLVLLMRYMFGTWTSGLLLLGILGVAGFVVYGIMSLLSLPIDFLSTGLFLMISVAALSDYLFITYQQVLRPGRWRSNLRLFLLPSFYTSLTTFIGFMSLYASDLQLIQRFGVLAGIGALVEWLIMFTLLPAIMTLVPSLREWNRREKQHFQRIIRQLVIRRLPRSLAMAAMAIYLLAAYAVFNLNVSDSLVNLFPPAHPFHQSFDYLEESRGWQGEISVVFPAGVSVKDRDEVMRRITRLPAVVHQVGAQRALDYIVRGGVRVSAADILQQPPSEITPLLRQHFAESGESRYFLYVKQVDSASLNRIREAIDAICSDTGCFAAGDLVVFADYSRRVPDALLRSFGTCLVLVSLLLGWLSFQSGQGRRLLPIFAAAYWGPAVMLTLLWVLQLNITFLTCVFASVLVGLTGDNYIQYLFARDGENLASGVGRRGVASVQVALIMGLVSLTFLGSSFAPSRTLGVLLAMGLVISLVGDLWILRALTSRRSS